MKVFISSLISGFGQFRAAVADAVTALGHQVVRAEDFGASADSAQQACLAGVRESDLVVLIMGNRYGMPQSSGLSATHEEYHEARDRVPVLAFVLETRNPEPQQQKFIEEVQGWEQGRFTADFLDAASLRANVTRALHEYILARESEPLDETNLIARAQSLTPIRQRGSTATLTVAVAGGPLRSILRPSELEDSGLQRYLQAEALTGEHAVLTVGSGTQLKLSGDAVQLVQDHGTRMVQLDETAAMLLVQPAMLETTWRTELPSIIEEVVSERLLRALRFIDTVLERVDPIHRISHLAIVARMMNVGHLSWRTQAERAASPRMTTMSMRPHDDIAATLSPPVVRRMSLRHEAEQLAEDLTVRLRREVKQ